MRVTLLFLAILSMSAALASVATSEQKPGPPVRLEIATEKAEYPFRGAIPLTITYTNTSKETVVLLANGTGPTEGFAGETFEITSGSGKKTYTIMGIDPAIQRVEIKPGESWKRTIKELAVTLSQANVNGRVLGPSDPLPDPFGRLDDYTLRLRYEPTVQNQQPPIVNQSLVSNTVKVKVRW